MLKDKDQKSTASKQIDTKEALKDQSGIKILDFGGSSGLVCDMETGICGPVNAKKEGKE